MLKLRLYPQESFGNTLYQVEYSQPNGFWWTFRTKISISTLSLPSISIKRNRNVWEHKQKYLKDCCQREWEYSEKIGGGEEGGRGRRRLVATVNSRRLKPVRKMKIKWNK